MSDIDFDELDKAVNSLVGDDKGVEKKEQPAEAPKPAEEPVKTESSPSPASLPSKRAGRFMDMKHDSSDMTKDSPSLMTSNKTTIKPLNSDIKPDSAPEEPSEDKPSKNDWQSPIDEPKTAEADEEGPKTVIGTPDPIEHQQSQKKDEEKELPDSDDKKDDVKEDDSKKTSPFLDDAKVEKRPLGGLDGDSKSEDLPKDKEAGKEPKDGSDEKAPEAPPEPVELPPELDKDLVAIEADEAPEISAPAAKEPESPKVEEKNEEKPLEKEAKDEADDKNDGDNKRSHKEEVSQLLASAASGSIPDQYKRENRSHELHAAHPLFDDEGFNKNPAAAPKKPKSGAKKIFQWIFISLGILLLGGSIGAAVFVLLGKS